MKDPGSAITHLIAMVAAAIASVPLLIKAAKTPGYLHLALKLPIFNSRHRYFGSHEIFHLFVMGGSLCHYMMMYQFVA